MRVAGAHLDRTDHGEREVEVARRREGEQLVLVAALDQLDAHAGQALAELAQHRGKDARARRLERADPHGAGRPRDERLEVGARLREPREDADRVAVEHHAGLAQRDRPRPAGSLDELHADGALERGDLLRDGRLGVAEALGGTREAARLGDGAKRHQVPDLDPGESISRHDRIEAQSALD